VSERRFEPFTIDVPVRLRAVAGAPLVVLLHGRGQDENHAERKSASLRPDLSWCLPRAPYPVEVEDRDGVRRVGASWYQYTGDAEAFRVSLRETGEWLLGVIERAAAATEADASRVAILGFSQGGYLAGSMALTWPERFAGAGVLGARIKTELLDGRVPDALRGVRFFSAHGENDASVRPGPSRACVEKLRAAGVAVEHRDYPVGHRLLPAMIDHALAWILEGPVRR